MSVFKVVKPVGQFEVVLVRTLQDKSLQLDELGLLVRLISRPHGWEIRPNALLKETSWGKDKLGRVLRNLQRAGYVKRQKVRRENGKWEWISSIFPESQGVDFYKESFLERATSETIGGFSGDGSPGDGSPGDGSPGDGSPGDGSPGDGSPGDGSPGDIDNTNPSQNRTETPPTIPPTTASHKGGGGISEYLRLGKLFGGKAGSPPRNPEGWEMEIRRRLKRQGGLSEKDVAQLQVWTKKEKEGGSQYGESDWNNGYINKNLFESAAANLRKITAGGEEEERRAATARVVS